MSAASERFDWLSATSIHGLQQIGRLQGNATKKVFFWGVVFASALVLLGLQANSLVEQLLTYPTSVERKEKVMQSSAPSRKKRQNDQQFTEPADSQSLISPPPTPDIHMLPSEVTEDVSLDAQMVEPSPCAEPTIFPNSSFVAEERPVQLTTTPLSVTYNVYKRPTTLVDQNVGDRQKRAASITCPGYVCWSTPILYLIAHNIAALSACILACVQDGDVAYSYIPTTLTCYCYIEDCCAYSGRIAEPSATNTGPLSACNDVFASGTVSPTAPFYDSLLVTYTCPSGTFNANGQTTTQYTCLSTGSWSPTFTTCSATVAVVSCKNQFVTTTGAISSPGPYTSGSSYTFTCKSGYLTTTSQSSVVYNCVGGSWDKSFVPCIAPCPDIFILTTGVVFPTAPFAAGSYVFTCAAGYLTAAKLPSETYTCANSNWDKSFVPCIAPCPDIFVLTTGVVSPTAPFTAGSYVFTCVAGYLTAAKLPSETYTCANSNWDKTFSSCIATCPNTFQLTTGGINPAAPFMSGSTYIFTCNLNFLTVDMLSAQPYLCSNGKWDRSFSPCYAVCPNIFDTTGSAGSPPFMGFPKTYTFTCIAGYLLPSYAIIQQYMCQTTGTWNPAIFTGCIAECQKILRPQIVMNINYNGPVVQNLIPSGLTGTFSCAANYTIFGSFKTSGCHNGSWSLGPSLYPKCFADCNMIDPSSLFPRLQVKYNRTNPIIHGSFATFSCNESYVMYGDFPNTTCVNGTWDVAVVDFPICLEQSMVYYNAAALMNFNSPSAGIKDTMATASSLLDMIPYITSNLSESMKTSLGFGRDDTLISCTYGDRTCDKNAEIIGFGDNSMGNCYTFNHKYLNESLIADRAGEGSGLYWILDSKQDEFVPMIATGGVKVMIHQRFAPLFPNAMGFAVSGGYTYSIALRRQKETRLSTPNKRCFSSAHNAQFYYLENSSYSNEACQRSFDQSRIMTTCGCGSPNLPNFNIDTPICDMNNRSCVNDVLSKANNQDYQTQMCPSACEDTVDIATITVAANSAKSAMFQPYKFTKDYERLNLISVKVFYETLNVVGYTEVYSFTILSLISAVGSSMGVLVGMSMVSLVELTIAIVQLIYIVTYRKFD